MFGLAAVGIAITLVGVNSLYLFFASDSDPYHRYGDCQALGAIRDCVGEMPVAIVAQPTTNQLVVRTVDGSVDRTVNRTGGSRTSSLGGQDVMLETWHGDKTIALYGVTNGAVVELSGYPPASPMRSIVNLAIGLFFLGPAAALYWRRRRLFAVIESTTDFPEWGKRQVPSETGAEGPTTP
jgi:hypothetical protein